LECLDVGLFCLGIHGSSHESPNVEPHFDEVRVFCQGVSNPREYLLPGLSTGGAKSLGPGGPPAVPSSCDCGLGGAIFLLRDSAEVEPEAALADFLAPNRSEAFPWLGESLAPPALRDLGTLGAIFIASGLGGTSVLRVSLPLYGSFTEELGSIS
jgi:hypothetical protein